MSNVRQQGAKQRWCKVTVKKTTLKQWSAIFVDHVT